MQTSLQLRNRLLAFLLVVLTTLGVWGAASTQSLQADASRAADPVLVLTFAPVKSGVPLKEIRSTTRSLHAALSSQPGFVSAESLLLPGEEGRGHQLVRAVVWQSVEDAESAALAIDGLPDLIGVLARTGPGRTTTYRQLRAAGATSTPATKGGFLELTRYRTKSGARRSENLARFDAAQPAFVESPGVLGDSTWISPTGQWLHLVRWRSAADFGTAAKALMKNPKVFGWIRSLDYKRFTVTKGNVILTP